MIQKLPKPKIIQVIAYYPPHLGGMENCAQNISKELRSRGYNVSVYTSDQGYSRKSYTANDVDVHYLKSIEVAHTPIIFSLFFKLLFLPKCSVVHVHISQAITPEIVLMVSKIRKIPYIAHFHLDVDPSGKLGFLLEPYKNKVLKNVLQNATWVICLSGVQKKFIEEKYNIDPSKIAIIPNGVSESFFNLNKKILNKIPNLLFVGRLAPQKNIPFLLRVMRLLKKKVTLDIVGEGEQEDELKKLIKEYRLVNVRLCGKKVDSELLEFYHKADVFVIPSFKEGISLAMLEAMASGLPIVALNVPGMNELIKNCGLVVSKRDESSFAEALDKLLEDKQKILEMGSFARKKAKLYSWGKVASSVDRLYKGVPL